MCMFNFPRVSILRRVSILLSDSYSTLDVLDLKCPNEKSLTLNEFKEVYKTFSYC